jgi:outer membrane lipoprotein LolB
LTAFLVQACAGTRGIELPDLPDWETRRSVLESIDRWEFSGRIGVSAGDEGFNGKLRWRQDGNDYRATVSGPLGVGTVQIEGNGNHVSLTDRKGDVTELKDAEIELRNRYGWTLPLDRLQYWALGIPDPSAPSATETGEDGLISEIRQGGWQVTIGQYREGGGQQMPRRISAINADAKVRLVIDHWAFHGN